MKRAFRSISLLALLSGLAGCGKGLLPMTGSGTGGSPSELARGALDPSFHTTGIVTAILTGLGNFTPLIATAYHVSNRGFLLEMNVLDLGLFESDLGVMKFLPDGSLDSSFGTNGFVLVSNTTGFANENTFANFFLQNGKIMVMGFNLPLITYARIDSTGALDSTFDSDGLYAFNHGGSSWSGGTPKEDPQGRILSVGQLNSDAYVLRILSDGGPDNSFDGDGLATTNIGGGGSEIFYDLAFQTDGKIVAAGIEGNGATSDMVVGRYSSTGSLDATFGASGIVTLDFAGQSDQIFSVVLQSDGKILAAGFSSNAAGTDTDFALVRLLTDGSLDTTYSGDGKATFDFGYAAEFVQIVTLDSLGRAIAGGSANGRHSLLVVNTDGSLDPDFGDQGLVRDVAAARLRALALDSNGKIMSLSEDVTAPRLLRHLP